MKKFIQLWCIPLLSLLLSGCGEAHFLKDGTYRQQVTKDFESKKAVLKQGDLFTVFDQADLSLSEKEALMFLYAYMPLGDITDHSGAYFLENIRLSEQARKEMAWGKEIPDGIYRHFVLPLRINNENLDHSRGVFFNELKNRVKHLSMKEAILEVNHRCHEKVVYRPSDARTSSPLASVKTAYGRCGEESTFTVAALRAVGIPARQVYTPRWAHTDDNHAWVEAWADGKWHFLGACEPEPVLNLGWFNAPASRGMLMHTKVFGRYNGPEELMLETPNYTEINVIDNYAPTAKAEILVVDMQGQPVSGAKVEFKIYNYAEFYSVATKYTPSSGQTSLTAGKGDMLVWASKEGRFGYTEVSFGKTEAVTITLDKTEGEAYTLALDLVPPIEGTNMPEVTAEQRQVNDRRMAQEDSIRNAYVATFITEEQAHAFSDSCHLKGDEVTKLLIASRGNYATLQAFLRNRTDEAERLRAVELLKVVSAKDLRDVSLEVLEDHLLHTVAFNPAASTTDQLSSAERYRTYVMNPRVANEMITPYKAFFVENLPQGHDFGVHPEKLVDWCNQQIVINDELNMNSLAMSPVGVWKARVADTHSRDIFFVSVARSVGCPARIDAVTGKVQYWSGADWQDVTFGTSVDAVESSSKGQLVAKYTPVPSLTDPKYYSHFTLSKFDNGSFKLLNYDEGDVDMGGGATWSNLLKNGATLDAGYYMLVTGTRLASGGVLSNVTFFTIEPGKTTTVDLVMREKKDAVQVIGSFNSESLYQPIQGADLQSVLQTCGRGYFVIGVLGVGQEPTNHALRDIAALGGEFEKWGRRMVLLFPSEEQYKKYNPSEFKGLPSTITYGLDVDRGIQRQIVEAMKLNKTTLPVFIVADTFNRVVFVSQGYTIGLGEQLMKVIHGL